MSVIVKSVNFIRSRGLHHRQFESSLESIRAEYRGILYYTEVRWLSRGSILKRFLLIHQLMTNKGKWLTNFQVYTLQWLADIARQPG